MELDIEDFDALREYLRTRRDVQEPVQFRHLLGGVSNRTVLITWADGCGWVMKQALPKLRVQADWFSNPERVRVEARALRFAWACRGEDLCPLPAMKNSAGFET